MPEVRSRWSARLSRVLLLSIVGLLVVSLGTVVATRDEHREPQPPSSSEIAVSKVRTHAQELARRADALAGAVGKPAAQSALSKTTRTLERHRRLLAPTGAATESPTPGTATGSPAPGTATGSARTAPRTHTPSTSPQPGATAASATPGPGPSPEPEGLASLVEALAASGRDALDDAANTTAGAARVLAIVGTEQLAAAHALANAASLPEPEMPKPHGLTAAKPSNCEAPLMQHPQKQQPSQKPHKHGRKQQVRALQATLTGVQRAVYAYQVATPRLSGKAASIAAERMHEHQKALEAGTQLLEAACGHVPAAEPAYELPPAFRNSPEAGLAAVERELADMYTDLTGLSDGAVRRWALAMLPRASQAGQHWELS